MTNFGLSLRTTAAAFATMVATSWLTNTTTMVVHAQVGDTQRTCNEELCQALSSALCEILHSNDNDGGVDPAYAAILDEYNLSADRFLPRPTDCTTVNYPRKPRKSMLKYILDQEELRVLYSPEAAPFSFEDTPGGPPRGVAIDLWPLLVDKLNAQYKVPLKLKYVSAAAGGGTAYGIDNQYLSLASFDDPSCANRDAPIGEFTSQQMQARCADVIGGGYAVNGPRQLTNDFTCTYMPLALSAIRNPNVPFAGGSSSALAAIDFDSPDDSILTQLQFATNPVAAGGAGETLRIGVIPNSAEVSFVNANLPYAVQILRNGEQNIFDFAAQQQQQDPVNGAHITMGQSARITYFRDASVTDPSVCSDCVISKLRDVVGTAFGTYKYECCSQDYATCGGGKNGCSQNKQACSNCDGYSWLVPPNAGTCVPLFGECSTTSGSPPCCTDGVVAVTCTETLPGFLQCQPADE